MKDWCDLVLTGAEEPGRDRDGKVVSLVGHIWSNRQRDPPKVGDVVLTRIGNLGGSQVHVDSLCAIQACNRPDGSEPFAYLGVRGHVIVDDSKDGAERAGLDIFLVPNEVGATLASMPCICRHRGPTHGPKGCTAKRCKCKAQNFAVPEVLA